MDSDINNLNNFLISESKYENKLSPDEIEARRKLVNSINELNEIQTHLLDCINQQDEKIDNIETNILSTQPLIETGKNELIEAKKYYFTYTPILVGTLIGAGALSPIGLLLNLKLSGLFSLSGGILGGYAGYKIQK